MEERLKVGQKIQLNIVEEPEKDNYYSRVEDIVETGAIVVAAPIKDGAVVDVGEKLNILFWDNTSQYAFEAKVIGRKYVGMPTITIKKCSELQRMQRRSYFRIQAMLKVVFDVENEDDGAKRHDYQGLTLDSGGGILLSTKTRIETGTNLNMIIYLSEHDYITAIGRVERVDFLSIKKLYRAGIDFFMIYESDRDKVVAFVFKKELELRRRGLL